MGATPFDPRADAAAASQLIRAKAALGRATGIDPDRAGLRFTTEHGHAVAHGELPDLARRRRAAIALADIGAIDQLRVVVPDWPGDGPTANRVARAFEENIDFRNCALTLVNGGTRTPLRETPAIAAEADYPSGEIDIGSADGVVTLRGRVISLSHKRLATALAWWSGLARDVVNELAVDPPEVDNDAELAEALKLVLETDPLLPADTIAVSAHDGAVRLAGQVPTEADARRAECDAWMVDGVREVDCRLVAIG
ncbi:BON domain-containing protein [Derxia gummosa]|uniref:BON domain-containing protein n=1 Tax=Derxia gummosa DSM 723 TaxID=1121388 RepID=A0A8B6X984_9BURK|nr:BON domain-containing protein [Derxia gummosa]